MMIRINLLPVRAAQKRELGRQFLILGVVVLIGTLVGNYLWYSNRDDELTRRQLAVTDTQRRISELEKVIGEVNNINKRKAEVKEKLDVLEKLRKARSGPVRMLDALATVMPKKVWLSNFNEKNGAVAVKGQAESHEDVSELMKGLQNIVWTPKGMGRIVEKKRDETNARVELLSGDGSMQEYSLSDLSNFFTGVELKSSTLGTDGLVTFDLQMLANYAI